MEGSGEGDALFHPHLSLPHQGGGVEGTEWLQLVLSGIIASKDKKGEEGSDDAGNMP